MRDELILIEQLLNRARPTHKTVGERLAWERGYLTGLLASLARKDSLVKSDIKRALSKKSGA